MQLKFAALCDQAPKHQTWVQLFHRLWPLYRKWYQSRGLECRPTYLECRRMLRRYMPELEPLWSHLCELTGGQDLPARFLSLYNPPAYLSGCSQAIWPGPEPLLVRNYDYSPRAFEAVTLHTDWQQVQVMGTSDCLIGLLDGVNDSGLCVSLTFGGRQHVGKGFGVPIILRYVLQTCRDVQDAQQALIRVPSHMAYNITALDASGQYVTVFLSPGRRPMTTQAAAVTNHQQRIEWAQHARVTASVEREQFLLNKLLQREISAAGFICAFLQPPIYSYAFSNGFGTLYTAAYWPRMRALTYHWPQVEWPLSLDSFVPSERQVDYLTAK